MLTILEIDGITGIINKYYSRGVVVMIYHAELVLNEQAILAEGPCWNFEENLLYWVDIIGGKVNVFNPVTEIKNLLMLANS